MHISSALTLLLAMPAAIAAPAFGDVGTSLRQFIKRDYCASPTTQYSSTSYTIPESDIEGLISSINSMGGWDTLVPLAGSHLITAASCAWKHSYGVAEICIFNDWWFESTHLSMGEAAWAVDWIAHSYCPSTG
jgi:hypothetical protein